MKRLLGALAILLLLTNLAGAQVLTQPAPVALYGSTGFASLSASTTSARVALPTTAASTPPATHALVTNTGSKDAYIALGDATVVATAADGFLVPAGQWRLVNIGSQTYVAAITPSGTTTLQVGSGNYGNAASAPAGLGGTSDTNVVSVGGAAVAVGQTTSANSIPVVLPSDQSLTVSGGTFVASGTVATTAADGSNVTLGTTTDAGSTATDATPATLTALAKGISSVEQSHNATVAAGTAPNNAVVIAGQYNSTLPTPSAGQTVALQTDQLGRLRITTVPTVYNMVTGTASQTSTTSTQLIAAVASKSIYVTSVNCANSGATASIVTFQDGSGGATLGVTENPAGSGSNMTAGGVPLFKTTAGNALYFAPGSASTTQYCSAAGFSQ